jgi:hypothetical protein
MYCIIIRPSVFFIYIKQSSLGSWFSGKSRFAYGFVFAEIFEVIVCKVWIPRSQWDFDDFRINYLDEYEAKCKMALARESGPYEELIEEKKPEGRKSRDTIPLNNYAG